MTEIKEIIVVEGRDDSAAVKRAVSAGIIETHGFGISAKTWDLIQKAYDQKGIIIFTDPDFSGRRIRKRLSEKFPKAKHAWLSMADAAGAAQNDGIGVENASPSAILEALANARCEFECILPVFTREDMRRLGFAGAPDSSARRAAVGKALGLGYANAASFLNMLNKYGVTTEKMNEALLACGYSRS